MMIMIKMMVILMIYLVVSVRATSFRVISDVCSCSWKVVKECMVCRLTKAFEELKIFVLFFADHQVSMVELLQRWTTCWSCSRFYFYCGFAMTAASIDPFQLFLYDTNWGCSASKKISLNGFVWTGHVALKSSFIWSVKPKNWSREKRMTL